ncbi:5'-3' exoribonuclease 4 [Morus notabilis]|uniref:5'-3' exoribonuclease 4 n=1 Tax=Morus notabilis TaxID=981085 RepID=W9RCG5_9ROSA|nr:5'-3' exoribonuclease 4 [Morus notabilis]
MGVPSFYKWLLESFPLSVVDVVFDPSPAPDLTGANPNGMEFDNLYLDMNGIIHPCFHPEGLPAPKTYEEVFKSVFKYIDKVFSVVRPRKLLYLAIDGVAPRAKMNQQRTRRFRAAKDAADEMSFMAPRKEEIGGSVSESQEKSTCLEQSSKLDSNVITPGTEFMALLSSALHYYIHLRMNEEPGWQGIKVILSDACVPGEGEHKIMSYIRSQRNLDGFDPNTRHCLYGLDADLIMLALATHEIHFSILREDVKKPSSFKKSGRYSSQIVPLQVEVVSETTEDYISKLKFQFLHVWILREYLSYAMEIPDQKDGDLERLIDDFVLICLFVGNDFLPHMPSLEISEGAIDLLMTIYKKEFVRMGGYITKSFKVNLNKMKYFLEAVGSHEGAILRKRGQKKKERDFLDRRFSKNTSVRTTPVGGDSMNSRALEVRAPKGSVSLSTTTKVDKIKYGEVGWKERYYAEKFEAETEDDCERIRQDVRAFAGLCITIMKVYAPGNDFHDIGKLKIQFTLGQPFKPVDQLMAVLPSASAHAALPLFYRKLMTETSSPLFAFYPTDFELDLNGKRFSWQAICKLPFIEESLLLSEIARVEHTLTDEERRRNRLGLDVLFVHSSHSFSESLVLFSQRNELVAQVKEKINPKFSAGMNGYMFIPDKTVKPEQIDSPIDGMEMIANNKVLSLFYDNPRFLGHIPRPPEKVAWPSKCICKKDIKPKPFLWHEQTAVVGRLHSLMPIRNSVSGSHLAKSARQLVLTWCLEMQQKSTGSLEGGEGASADGVLCCEHSRTVCPGGVGANGPPTVPCTVEVASVGDTAGDKSCSNGGDGISSARKSKKRRWKSKQINDCELMASRSNLQGTSSAHVTGDDKSCSNGRSDGQVVVVLDNNQRRDESTHQLVVDRTDDDKSSIYRELRKRIKMFKRNKGGIVPNVNVDGLSCNMNLKKGICADETPCEKTIAADELRTQAVGVPDNNQGGDESTHQLQDQTAGDKRSTDGGSGKRKQNNDCEFSDHSLGANGMVSRSNLQGTSSAHVTGDDKSYSNGRSDEQAVVVPDNNQRRDESTHHLVVDRTDGDKSSIYGELRKRIKKFKRNKGSIVPNVHVDGLSCNMNLKKGICADETPCEKTIAADELRTQAVGVPDNNQGGDESTHQLQDQTAGDKSSTDGGSGKRKQDNDCEFSDHSLGANGMASRSNLQGTSSEHVTGDDKSFSNGRFDEQAVVVPDNNQRGDESTHQLVVDQTDGDKRSIYGELRKRIKKSKRSKGSIVPNVHIDGLSCNMSLKKGICADKTPCEKTIAADESRTQAVGVPDNNQGGDESTHQLQDQTAGDKSSTDGGSGKRKTKQRRKKGNKLIPNEDGGTVGLSSNFNLEKGICAEGQGEKTIVAELSKQAVGVQGKEELACQLLVDQTADDKSIVHEGKDGISCHVDLDKGIFAKGAHRGKTIAAVVTRKQVGVPDKNQGGDELTYQLQINQKAGGESSIDGGSRKRKQEQRQKRGTAIPDEYVGLDGLACCSNLVETVCASGHEGDKKKVCGKSLGPKQGQEKRNVIPDNIVGGIESTFSTLREAVYATPTETKGN